MPDNQAKLRAALTQAIIKSGLAGRPQALSAFRDRINDYLEQHSQNQRVGADGDGGQDEGSS